MGWFSIVLGLAQLLYLVVKIIKSLDNSDKQAGYKAELGAALAEPDLIERLGLLGNLLCRLKGECKVR